MTTYSPEFKASIIAKMLPPNNVGVPDLAVGTQIPEDTLHGWRAKARGDAEGAAVAATPAGELGSEEKFAMVVETGALNETELSEYCRRRGLYPQRLDTWRTSCLQANTAVSSKIERTEVREQKQRIKQLERELRRKEKALAEAAALLVLQKKSVRSSRSPRTKDRVGATTNGEHLDRRGLRGRGAPGASLPGYRLVRAYPAALA